MPRQDDRRKRQLIEGIDALHRHISRSQRKMLQLIAEVDRQDGWRDSGARDTAHWLSMRQGISEWKARRWVPRPMR